MEANHEYFLRSTGPVGDQCSAPLDGFGRAVVDDRDVVAQASRNAILDSLLRLVAGARQPRDFGFHSIARQQLAYSRGTK